MMAGPNNITVVVPVYKGAEISRACLQHVCDNTDLNTVKLLIINDSSPEPEVTSVCRQYAEQPGVELIENDTNLGFVKTINLAMDHAVDDDIVILNSDTLVFDGWLARMAAVAYQDDRIATVTPFSNNATICSYPAMAEWQEGYQPDFAMALDALFVQCNSGRWHEIPTAVGFCTYIKRAGINAVGKFDAEAFGKGYGEECDFSLRLRAAGLINVIAADVFVHHHGSVSFGDSADERKIQAEKIIADRYPSYASDVRQFISDDPLAEFKAPISAKIAADFPLAGGLMQYYRADAEQLGLTAEAALASADSIAQELDKSNRQYAALDQQLKHAETLLQQAREAFATTDASLSQAQAAAQRNADDMARLGQERDALALQRDELGQQRALLQSEANNLREQLDLIKRSRAWRLIQWIKKLLGKQ